MKTKSESNTQLNSHTFKSSENSAHLQTNNQSAYRNEDVGYEGTLCVDWLETNLECDTRES